MKLGMKSSKKLISGNPELLPKLFSLIDVLSADMTTRCTNLLACSYLVVTRLYVLGPSSNLEGSVTLQIKCMC